MFWVVTTSMAFCAISLADVLRCFATDQWHFRKSKKALALARFFSREKQSQAISKQPKNTWHQMISLLHIHSKEWRIIRDAWIRILDSIRTFICSGRTRRGRNSSNASKLECGSDTPGIQDKKIIGDRHTELISSPTFRQIHHYAVERIYDIQFSPDGEWVAVCATLNSHAIHVRSDVSLASTSEINGTAKRIYRLRTSSLRAIVLAI